MFTASALGTHFHSSPRGSSGGCGSPRAAQPVQGRARCPLHPRRLHPPPFSRLIPHTRLMNNVIKGAITLFLNAF